jgi:NAD(P)-dependent dehydrogenase (short-subunit alcohol dehydrogenase family)
VGKLDDRIAIVTGAAQGIGVGIAHRLADEGAVVVCADRDDSSETAKSISASASGVKADSVYFELTDIDNVESVIGGVASEYGGLDILVNNAGVAQPVHDVVDTPIEVFEEVHAINVRGVFAACRAGGRIMRDQGRGSIINVSSQLGKQAWPGWGSYASSKFAVIGLTQALALELAPYGVRANAICPGTIETRLVHQGFEMVAKREGKKKEEALAEHIATIPIGRLGRSEEMGAIVAFLASDDSSFITGAAINATGGEKIFF